MPKSPPPPPRGGSSRGSSSGRGSSRRAAPTKVSKPFPWGTVLGSLVLGAVLIGVVAYAALNQGSGISSVLTDPDNNIEGVVISDEKTLTRNHVQGAVNYPQVPPPGGDHNPAPQQCAVYNAPIAPEHAVHSLEHGAVWITYDPAKAADQVDALAATAGGDPYLLMSPIAGQASPILLTAWGRQLAVSNADDERVDQFINAYSRNGPQTPERGAACVGNTTTGAVRGAAPDGAILPSGAATAPATGAPSPAASPPAAPVPSPATS